MMLEVLYKHSLHLVNTEEHMRYTGKTMSQTELKQDCEVALNLVLFFCDARVLQRCVRHDIAADVYYAWNSYKREASLSVGGNVPTPVPLVY